jgi:hypothetical protein
MYISQLINKLAEYDKYGEHRTNGLKAVFVAELLFVVNFIYAIPNPYFYYFYIPLTAFAAEVAGNTLGEKFLFYFYTVMGSILAVFLFGMFQPYKIFFVFFIFFYSLLLYHFALYKIKSMFIPAPIILSLAMYSLTYGNTNTNFYIALNHSIITFIAMLIVMSGLLLFPRKYYFKIWQQAYVLLLGEIISKVELINRNETVTLKIIDSIQIMKKYTTMLNRRMPIFSICKITLLSFDMVMSLSYLVEFSKHLNSDHIIKYENTLRDLHEAVKKNSKLEIKQAYIEQSEVTHELHSIYQMILSWNYICSKKF